MPYSEGAKRTMRRYGRKRKYHRKKSTKKVSKSVKKYVKKQIHKNIENKIVSINQTLAFGNITESPDLNLYPVLPYSGYTSIPQGVTQGGRLANRCRVMKVLLKYVLHPLAYDPIVNPNPVVTEVQLFLLRLKQSPGLLPTAGNIASIVQLGGSSVSLSGNLSDIAINSWNKDLFGEVKTWTHKLGYASATGTGAVAGAQYYSNNDFKLNVIKRMDITKYVAKTMVFDDSGSTHLGKNIFFGFQCVNAGSMGILGSTITPARITYWIDIIYEDA